MNTIRKTATYNATADKDLSYFDDPGVTGMHMTQSSIMMMGSKLHLQKQR